MNRTIIIAVTCLLLLGTAGFVTAADPGDKTQWSAQSERYPECEPGQEAIGTDKAPGGIDVSGDVNFGDNDVAYVCSGEQWDGQNPTTRNSDTTLLGDNDGEGFYVNPLGDCSGWDSSDGGDGCAGGVDRPGLTDPVHVHASGDASGDDTGVFVNEETFAVGRAATAVGYNTATHDTYVAVYLEDHSDQVFFESLPGDGNMLANVVDYVQSGVVAEGDCTQDEYEQGGTNCPRDNTAITVEVTPGWLVPAGQTADTGVLLP